MIGLYIIYIYILYELANSRNPVQKDVDLNLDLDNHVWHPVWSTLPMDSKACLELVKFVKAAKSLWGKVLMQEGTMEMNRSPQL